MDLTDNANPKADMASNDPAPPSNLSPFDFRPKGTMLSVPEQIADQICAAILDGDYQPGQRIPETQLAQSFGVSRGPVREALRLLENEGLITVSPRRGARVTALSLEEVEQLFDIRAALSSLAAKRAAMYILPAEIDALQKTAADIRKSAERNDNVQVYSVLSARAGQTISRAARNPRLISMMLSLSRQTLRYAQLGLSSAERRRESAKNWSALADAIERGDAEEAGRINGDMILQSRDAAMAVLRETQENEI